MPNNAPGTNELRGALVSAMAKLSGAAPGEAFDLFQRLLDPNEPPAVRQAAVAGLPAAGERAGDYIARELQPAIEPDASVRKEAAIALGRLGSFTYAKQLDDASRKQYEPDDRVREAAWKAFQSLLPSASIESLEHWADIFHQEAAPNGPPAIRKEERELAVRKELAQKFQRAGDLQSLAVEQQRIGELYTSLVPPQYSDAASYLQLALNYWEHAQAQPAKDVVVAGLVRELEDALLQSGQYRDAIQFGAKEVAQHPDNQGTIVSSIRNRVDELMEQGKNGDLAAYKSASDLISEALKKESPLDSNQRFTLDEIRRSIPPSQ